jgi:hypothetical protein
MKAETLHFPSNAMIADFIAVQEVGGLIINSAERTVTGVLPDAVIALACRNYGAYFKSELTLS